MPSNIPAEKTHELQAKLTDMAYDYSNIKQDKRAFPLGKEHTEALRGIRKRKDIIVTRPDKGAGVVLLNKSDFIHRKC